MIRTRYRRILWFFIRLIVSIIFWDLFLPRLGLRQIARRTRSTRFRKAAVSFRKLAIQMGGVLIKVGQFLSSRVDILPPEIIHELEGLQDEVPPESFQDIRKIIEAEFSAPLLECFTWFEEAPLAAASLGQVHRARLKAASSISMNMDIQSDSPIILSNVVVKVLRPNIDRIIETDLAALRIVGGWVHRYRPIRLRANVPELINEFSYILHQEVDYLNEGKNAETFAENFKTYPGVRVPYVCWSHTTRRVLTLEDVYSIKVTDYSAIEAAGVRREEVASRLLDTYLKQIFEDGFFHADPHPGNLFVQPLPENATENGSARAWALTFVDFGMTSRVPANLRAGLRELLIGVGLQDSSRVVHAYQMMGMLLPSADLAQIERAGTQVFEKFWGKNMSELNSVSYQDMRELADEFGELIYDMPFQVPQNMIFLGRCIGILSGMCTGLDPQFNLWEHLAPFAKKIVLEESGKSWEIWLAETGKLARAYLTLPSKIEAAIQHLEHGDLTVHAHDIPQQVKRLSHAVHGLTCGLIFSAFLLSGILLHINGFTSQASGVLLIGVIFLVGSLVFLRGDG